MSPAFTTFSSKPRLAVDCLVQLWVVQLQRGELLLLTLHTQEPRQILLELSTSARSFDRWLREQLQLLLGWNLQEVLPG
jgi:hypothetical protein